MSNIHDETLAELREVAEKGVGSLRKRSRTLLPVTPVVHYILDMQEARRNPVHRLKNKSYVAVDL